MLPKKSTWKAQLSRIQVPKITSHMYICSWIWSQICNTKQTHLFHATKKQRSNSAFTRKYRAGSFVEKTVVVWEMLPRNFLSRYNRISRDIYPKSLIEISRENKIDPLPDNIIRLGLITFSNRGKLARCPRHLSAITCDLFSIPLYIPLRINTDTSPAVNYWWLGEWCLPFCQPFRL